MADVTAAAVKELREKTGLPMMMCKKALTKAEGDQEKAIELLREEAGKVMVKRADNPTAEGRIFTQVKEDGSLGAMVELQCESAPVATSDDFVHLGEQLVQQLLEGPGAETPDELLEQAAPGHDGEPLKEIYEQTVNRIREKIVVAKVLRLEGPVAGYVHHDGKTGVLFQAEGEKGDDPVLRDVAMHIAALKPTVTTPEDLDPQTVQAERDRLAEEARQTGKPENIIEKIVEGRMKNFYVDQGVLVVQPFAKDDTKTVNQVLAEHGLTPKGFTRWVLGV